MANNIYPTLYIPTCDSNSFVLKYFQYFFNKYWGNHINVKILGFNKPNVKFDKNIEFISLGTEQIGGANGWSNYLIDFLYLSPIALLVSLFESNVFRKILRNAA